MSSPFTIETRYNYGTARLSHATETIKFSLAILFGISVIFAFASKQVLDGPMVYVMTTLIIGVCLVGFFGVDGCIQDVKAIVDDAPPEEQETNVGKVNKAFPYMIFRVLILIVYVAIGGTQLIMLYS